MPLLLCQNTIRINYNRWYLNYDLVSTWKLSDYDQILVRSGQIQSDLIRSDGWVESTGFGHIYVSFSLIYMFLGLFWRVFVGLQICNPRPGLTGLGPRSFVLKNWETGTAVPVFSSPSLVWLQLFAVHRTRPLNTSCHDRLPCSTNIWSLLARDKFCGCVHCSCIFGSEERRRGLIEIGTVLSWSLLIGWGLSPHRLGLIAIQLVHLRCGTRWWSSQGQKK